MMLAISSLSHRYQSSFTVRRRWQNDQVFLIDGARILEVDAFSDAVFTYCNGVRTVSEIIACLIETHPTHAPLEVAAHVLYNLAAFERGGLIDPGGPIATGVR
jgi:hypothetical protein